MTTLNKQDIYKEIIDDNGMVTANFRLFCESLRNKVNNTVGVTTSVEAQGDVFITVDNLYFNDNFWPLTLPSTQSVLYRDESLALSWELPADLNLSPETGKLELFLGTTAPSGWILFDGGTIGNAASGATLRANADTETLFKLWWDTFDNSIAPVSSGRGASAQNDFDANKTITLNDLDSRLLAVYNSVNPHMSQLGIDEFPITPAMLPSHEHLAWFSPQPTTEPTIPDARALAWQTNLAKSGNETISTWSDIFDVDNSKYDSETFTNFNVQQPSFNCNIIVKL